MLLEKLIFRVRRLISKPPKTSMRWTADIYPQYSIGVGTYGRPDVKEWGEGKTLVIGKYCSIASGVQIFLGGEHRADWVTTYPFSALHEEARSIAGHPHSKGDVRIGNDVWIGTEAIILSGVSIGSGAIIGARALVARDVKPYSIVAGNPAKEIRKRFDAVTIDRLLRTRWWDLPECKLTTLMPYLLSNDIEKFLQVLRESGFTPDS